MSDFNNPWSNRYENTWDEGNNDYDRWFNDNEENSSDVIRVKKINTSNPDEIQINSRADIIIVIDPGHGGTKGLTGSVYISSCKHKIQGSDGKAEVDGDGKEKIITTKIDDLPTYVRNEFTKDASTWKWITKKNADNSKSERSLVWDVSQSLKTKLSSAGYTTYVSRENKIIEGREDRSLRNKFANKKGAHYFLSVHADGNKAFWLSGSHAIYRKSIDADYNVRQKAFADDVFSNYNVVTKERSPRNDTRGLQVLSTQNKSLRKSIIELGFVTNTEDYNTMISNVDLMAKQIAQGTERSISKIYYTGKRGKLLGYYYNEKVYRTRELAYEAYNKNNPVFAPPASIRTEVLRKPFAYYEIEREYLASTIT